VSAEAGALIGLSKKDMESPGFLNIISGQAPLNNESPYAMCYGGHQFGNWAGQLGDGRAINIGQVRHDNTTWTLQLKGAGPTPYSRSADGLAVLRSSIREHLCSEAMHALGVPTTRSLSLALSGDEVLRDVMYDGNPEYEKGAIVCRMANTFIRFGSFEIFTARQDLESLQQLADYTIKRHFPIIKSSGKDKYIEFFKSVCDATRTLIVHWQRVGFVHGVMNTDNMSILGQTIDFGPYGWLEGYDPNWTPNTTDARNKRYRYGNQPRIALWNLLQLANALYPLINEKEILEEILNNFPKEYQSDYLLMMSEKLGLDKMQSDDQELIQSLENNLQLQETDMTIFFRNLSAFDHDTSPRDFIQSLAFQIALYDEKLTDLNEVAWLSWFSEYKDRLQSILDNGEREKNMNLSNPKYVLRNYMAQLAIDKADKGDYSLIEELHQVLKRPYDAQPKHEQWFAKRPDWARHKVGCSMLSCSS